MRALSIVDHIFLLLDNQKHPMNVAGLCIFELPEKNNVDFVQQLINELQIATATPTFPFNQTLYKNFFWKNDKNFNIHNHFFHVSLPNNANMSELLTYISTEHSRPMNRQHPLWQFHLIDNIAPEYIGRPNRIAIYLKLHHAMADGIAAMRLLQLSLSPNPNEHSTSPFWVLPPKKYTPSNSSASTTHTIKKIFFEQLDTIKPVCQELIKRWQDRHAPEFTSSFDAPPSILNQKIQSNRYIGVISFTKDRLSKIAKVFSVTTNDVVLAVCSGALRAYLLQQNALPAKPLIAFMPISLRQDKSMLGNQISFLLTNLGTHQTNCIERLSIIAKSTQDGKNRFAKMTQAQIINYSLAIYGLAGLNLATGAYPKKQAFNLIISNIPGSKTPLYWNRAKLTNIFPLSVLLDGQALNITLANHQNKIDFGITACETALPNIHQLLNHLDDALCELEKQIL